MNQLEDEGGATRHAPTKRELWTFRTIMIIWLLVLIVIFVALIASHGDQNRHGG